MLDMGFEPQIRRIVERHDLPPKERRQTLLFSATFAPPIQRVAASYLREPYAHVAVGRVGSSIEAITQSLVLAEQPDNQKAHFRHAQLLGRAGELDSAKTLLERLCRQQPTERAFRTELTSVQARLKQTRAETREFWSGVAKGLGVAKVTVDVEDGRTDGERGVAVAAPMGVIATVMACLRRVVLWLWLMVRVWLMAWLRAWQRFRAVCVDERRPHIDEAEHERSL